ncbi:MAG: starch synthase, partial [Thiohalocapsa sp.]
FNADALWHAVDKAITLAREQPERWRAMILTGMRQDLSWEASARRYEAFYTEGLEARRQHAESVSA